MPTAIGRPCPIEPVVASIPGIPFLVAMPIILLPSLQYSSNNSFGKKPFSANITYNADTPQPLLNINRSLSGSDGLMGLIFKNFLYKYTNSSTQEYADAICEALPFTIIDKTVFLHLLA